MNEKISELPSELVSDLAILNEAGLEIMETVSEFACVDDTSPLYKPLAYYLKSATASNFTKKFSPEMDFSQLVRLVLNSPEYCRDESEFKQEAMEILEKNFTMEKASNTRFRETYGDTFVELNISTKGVTFTVPMKLNPKDVRDKYHIPMDKAESLSKNKEYIYALASCYINSLVEGRAEDFRFCTKWDLTITSASTIDGIKVEVGLVVPYSRINTQMISGLKTIFDLSVGNNIPVN